MATQDKPEKTQEGLRDLPIDERHDDENPVGHAHLGVPEEPAIARPRDRAAESGDADVEAGFTTTGPSGSSGGRVLYGMDATEKHEPVETEDEL